MWYNKYLNKGFADKGRGPNLFDCWGLVQHVYKIERNIDLPSYLDSYQHTLECQAIAEKIEQEQKKWDLVNEPKEFDVIILRMNGLPMHVGIITNPNYMLHCIQGVGTVHESYNNMRWKSKVVGYARYRIS